MRRFAFISAIKKMNVFVCESTYEFELGACEDVKLYSSIEELKKSHNCAASGECNIVQLTLDLNTAQLLGTRDTTH